MKLECEFSMKLTRTEYILETQKNKSDSESLNEIWPGNSEKKNDYKKNEISRFSTKPRQQMIPSNLAPFALGKPRIS